MPKASTAKVKQPETDKGNSTESVGPLVMVVKTGNSRKLSPRGEGEIVYMLGILDDKVLLRLAANNSGGRHSKEWVALETIQKTCTPAIISGKPFKSNAFMNAFSGKSNNNSGFLVAVLRTEGVFTPLDDKPHLSRMVSTDAFDAWEKDILNMPRPKDAEHLPLHPPQPNHLFKKDSSTTKTKEPIVEAR